MEKAKEKRLICLPQAPSSPADTAKVSPSISHILPKESDYANVDALRQKVANFKAGQIRLKISKWKELTSDKDTLGIVSGFKIPFLKTPTQSRAPPEIRFNASETEIIASELAKMQLKGVIQRSRHEAGEFISTIFIRPKKDGVSHRLILNLSYLNEYIEYHHFKMENLSTAVVLTKENCYFGSIDLKDAYYSVPIARDSQKFLKFRFQGHLYQFTCMPNGLACAPRIFTKLLKPVYAFLRAKGHESVAYIDDSCLLGRSYAETKANITDTLVLFQDLGFMIHPEKSVITPTQKITFLGFVIDSQNMTVSLTPEKRVSLQESCNAVLSREKISIRDAAKLAGTMNACSAGLEFGPLMFRSLENEKTAALKHAYGNFEAKMELSNDCKQDILLFAEMARCGHKNILRPPITLEIRSDASLKGFGGVLIDANNKNEIVRTQGQWAGPDTQKHINVLELEAAFLCLKGFCNKMENVHVRLLLDSSTGVCYVKNQGGTHSLPCNAVARKIWDFCRERNISLTVSHIPGVKNDIADAESRKFNSDTEWMLNPKYFDVIESEFGTPCIDMFASRLNHLLPTYVAFRPDGDALAIDAFSIDWSVYKLAYCFPPFSLIPRVLRKANSDMATCLLIYPHWPSQPWYPRLMKGIIKGPLPLPKASDCLLLPQQPGAAHPLLPKLQLMACVWSGKL